MHFQEALCKSLYTLLKQDRDSIKLAFLETNEPGQEAIFAKLVFKLHDIVRLPNENFGCHPKNSLHKMFLHICVIQYVRSLKLNDASLASLKKSKYSRWRPRWLPKDKILNIFLSMWAIHIIFVAIHRFLRSRNR